MTLVFHDSQDAESDAYDSVSPLQIVNLLARRADCCPTLERVVIGSIVPENVYDLKLVVDQMMEDQVQLRDLKVEIAIGSEARGLKRTFMDDAPLGRWPPCTKWFPNHKKYAARREKLGEYEQAVTELCHRPENAGLNGVEMQEAIRADPGMSELHEKIRLDGFPPVEYESEDAKED